MRARTVLVLLVGLLTSGWGSTIAHGKVMEAGGSNYVAVALDPAKLTADANWKDSRIFHSPICEIDQFGDRIQADLRAMHAAGQKKISFVLWHADLHDGAICHGFLADSGNEASVATLATNLARLEALAAAAGFSEVEVRFAPQWINNPGEWTHWSDRLYQSNLRLVERVMRSAAHLPGLRVRYDLGVELGGSSGPFAQDYAEKMWSTLASPELAGETFGFSIAYQPGRLSHYLGWKLPGAKAIYEVDIYGGEYRAILQLAQEARAQKQAAFEFVVGEAYYDDPATFAQIERGSGVANVPILDVMQWPLTRGAPGHISVALPVKYDYLPPN